MRNTFHLIKQSVQSLFILSLISILGVTSCKTAKSTSDAAQKMPEKIADQAVQPLEKALLWKIEGKDLQEASYLFGTIHMIDKENFFWPKGTLAAIEDAESVTFEIDMGDMMDMGKQMELMQKAFMKDNLTLKDLYNEEEYTIVKDHFEEMGIPIMFMQRLKPMFLTVFASSDIDLSKGLGGDSDVKSYEMEIWDLAKESDKPVTGLETMDFQISVFDSIPYEAQAQMLLESIKSADTEDDAFKQMIDLYKSQDIEGMMTFMEEEGEGGIQGFEDLLLYQRNKNWIPIMGEQMRAGKVIFAVGAGHLGGKDGVIDLLRKEGYKLTPLSHVRG